MSGEEGFEVHESQGEGGAGCVKDLLEGDEVGAKGCGGHGWEAGEIWVVGWRLACGCG